MEAKKYLKDTPFHKWTEEQRIQALKNALNILLTAANNYSRLFEKETKENVNLNSGFVYFFETFKHIIELSSYVTNQTPVDGIKYTHYLLRDMFESSLRLEHYVKQERKEQDKISSIEILRSVRMLKSDETIEFGGASKTFSDLAIEFNLNEKYHDSAKSKKIFDPFPDIKTLASSSFLNKLSELDWYFHYEYLCELTHGKLVGIISLKDERQVVMAYRRNLFYSLKILIFTLLLTDKHINFVTKDMLAETIKLAETTAFEA